MNFFVTATWKIRSRSHCDLPSPCPEFTPLLSARRSRSAGNKTPSCSTPARSAKSSFKRFATAGKRSRREFGLAKYDRASTKSMLGNPKRQNPKPKESPKLQSPKSYLDGSLVCRVFCDLDFQDFLGFGN